MKNAKKQFIESNLLAARYAIDEKTALIRQVKIWNLPNISIQLGAYQTQTRKWFPESTTSSNSNLGKVNGQEQQCIEIG